MKFINKTLSNDKFVTKKWFIRIIRNKWVCLCLNGVIPIDLEPKARSEALTSTRQKSEASAEFSRNPLRRIGSNDLIIYEKQT